MLAERESGEQKARARRALARRDKPEGRPLRDALVALSEVVYRGHACSPLRTAQRLGWRGPLARACGSSPVRAGIRSLAARRGLSPVDPATHRGERLPCGFCPGWLPSSLRCSGEPTAPSLAGPVPGGLGIGAGTPRFGHWSGFQAGEPCGSLAFPPLWWSPDHPASNDANFMSGWGACTATYDDYR
jgi:hypothetical protein